MVADKRRQWMQRRGDAVAALATDKRQWFGGVASRQVVQGNSGEAVMAAADDRRWQTRAEARMTAAGERGQQ